MASIFGTALNTALSTAAAMGQAAAAAKKNNSTSKGNSSSGGSSSTGTSGGSATNVNTFDSDQSSIKAQMNANSQAWHNTTDQAERDRLHQENQRLAGLLGGNVSYNGSTGTWSGSAGMPETEPYEPGDYSDYIRDMNEYSLQSSLNALKSAYDKNVSTLQAEQDKLAPMYQNARNQEAADSALSKQRFNETAAAYGLNTGTAGQANLSYATQLQSDLSALQAAETAANQEIERQRSDLAVQYQNAIAQAKADNNMQLAQQLYNEAIRRDEALQQQSQYNSSLALQKYQTILDQQNTDRSYDYTVSQNQREDALNAAALAAQFGDYSKYGELYGWDDAFTQQMNQKYAAAMASSGKSGSGGDVTLKAGEGGGNYGALYADAQTSGYPESYIANNYKRYGFTSTTGLSDGYYDWAAQDAQSGMNESHFNAFANSVSSQLAGGKAEAAVNNVAARWGSLSNGQKNQIQSLLSRYGYTYAED